MCEDIKIAAWVINRNATYLRQYSPVTLDSEWSEAGRLIFFVLSSAVGMVMNGFFISCFFIDPSLRKPSNVFLACIGLADFTITGVIAPSCAVVLLSRQWDVEPVCVTLNFFGEVATYSYNLFFMMVGIENVFQHYNPNKSNKFFGRKRVGIITLVIYLISFSLAGAGVLLKLDYDYCTRAHSGNIYFRRATAILFQIVPFVITTANLIIACVLIRRNHYTAKRSGKARHNRYASTCESDCCHELINVLCYGLFVAGWIPYLIVINRHPEVCDAKFYHSVWVGLCRSIVSSFFHACMSAKYRKAYVQLFKYCFCKISLNTNYTTRHRRTLVCKPKNPDIKVHLAHHITAASSTSRYSTTARGIQEL